MSETKLTTTDLPFVCRHADPAARTILARPASSGSATRQRITPLATPPAEPPSKLRPAMGEKRKCWICKPVVETREGADHFGMDAFMRCKKCGWRTISHVECITVTPNVVATLKGEWNRGRRGQTQEPFL